MVVANRWRALAAAFLGWMLDGYDFTILTLVLIEIQEELSMTSTEAGALGTVTLLTRLVGGMVGGKAADRFGRKAPLMISILWFSFFSLLSGFATSYWMLLAFRALFGLGMGAEWAAGMPLVLEHWPERSRGAVSGFVQGAFSWGFILAAGVVQIASPRILEAPWGWRVMLWSGVVPALLVFWVRRSVPESPVWLERNASRSPRAPSSPRETSLPVWPILLLGAMMFAYQSLSFWYGTLVRAEGQSPLLHVTALNLGGILGAAAWGAVAGTRLGASG
ncbi:MAG TPA: MFS transporter, partial [Vicinamibacteria bacterium]|nr:MFS transporter [Vicinamibacteria bacterium]